MFDIFRASGWIFSKLARIYHWNNFQKQLDFGDLDLIFKVTGVLEQMKFSLKFYLSLDSYQTWSAGPRRVGYLTRKSGVLGSIPDLATYFRFSFRFFKKLLAKVCARSTG